MPLCRDSSVLASPLWQVWGSVPAWHGTAQPAMPGMCRMRWDLTAGGRGAEQPMSHLEGWQRHGEACELGQSQSCCNPLTQSLLRPNPP